MDSDSTWLHPSNTSALQTPSFLPLGLRSSLVGKRPCSKLLKYRSRKMYQGPGFELSKGILRSMGAKIPGELRRAAGILGLVGTCRWKLSAYGMRQQHTPCGCSMLGCHCTPVTGGRPPGAPGGRRAAHPPAPGARAAGTRTSGGRAAPRPGPRPRVHPDTDPDPNARLPKHPQASETSATVYSHNPHLFICAGIHVTVLYMSKRSSVQRRVALQSIRDTAYI